MLLLKKLTKKDSNPVPKPGKNPSLSTSYRTILLLVLWRIIKHQSKITERDTYNIKNNGILPILQFGFRAAHSILNQVTIVVTDIAEGFNNVSTLLCFSWIRKTPLMRCGITARL
ncbi:hypothetical protein AMK59_436 [Oryctes borbonicus]|uniref:Reverse transcriptase domain-containing protein n=1 Tax=Oryctes borbonicus TaxID=1629725 RepID=A0A0T6BE74_9SCAR|nr:hypothetical protein AMK59_436 [Oryctes borbonicus]